MVEQRHSHVYRRKDLEKAYDMGLENAIIILEKSIGLSVDGQKEMLNSLKKMRDENRIRSMFERP